MSVICRLEWMVRAAIREACVGDEDRAFRRLWNAYDSVGASDRMVDASAPRAAQTAGDRGHHLVRGDRSE